MGKKIGYAVAAYAIVGLIVYRATNTTAPADTSLLKGILLWPKQLLNIHVSG